MFEAPNLFLHGEFNQQITDLVNEHSRLVRKLDISDVSNADYCVIAEGDTIAACVEIVKVSWYQAEIRHLVVRPDVRRRGLGRRVLTIALEQAKDNGARIAQCTIRTENVASTNLFKSAGFKSPFEIVGLSGRMLGVWQRIL